MTSYLLKSDIKSHFVKGRIYGKKGEKVQEISRRGDVMIVQGKHYKFPVLKSELIKF